MTTRPLLLTFIPLAYLVGSVPFGLIVGLAKGVDPRTAGSGNIGATNVARLLGRKFFFLVFFLDMLKSLIPMAIASAIVYRIPPEQRDAQVYLLWLLVGFAAVLGHMFSVFLKFKGGKGVATSAGVMLGLYPFFTAPGLVAVGVFLVVFFLDMLKSAVPMAIASAMVGRIPPDQRDAQVYLLWLLVGFAAVLGHMFSVFLKFKGGKGVATSAGVMLGLYPYFTAPGLVAVGVFLVVFFIWRYVSLGSILAAGAFPLVYLTIGLSRGWPVFGSQLPLLIFAFVIALLITYKHRTNISRLLAGTENRIGGKSNPAAAPPAAAPEAKPRESATPM
jgi:glycerol-3-phosphate acyltransferase PlsY